MAKGEEHRIEREILERYLGRTKGSKSRDARARARLPGGDTRTSTYYLPYPAYMMRGEGCYVFDCDGNEYLDFLNNYTSLIHGHAHPAIVKAVRDQAGKGLSFPAPTENQAVLGEMISVRGSNRLSRFVSRIQELKPP